MLVELHKLQNFAPSSLNADDNGAPKDCEFGGYRRARISSQCQKRAMREAFSAGGLLPPSNLAVRTKRLVREVSGRLANTGRDPEATQAIVVAALRGLGLSVDGEGRTQYALFLGEREIDNLARICDRHWDVLAEGYMAEAAVSEEARGESGSRGRSAKETKKAGRGALPTELRNALDDVLDGGKAADLALFGRMVADRPDKSPEGAAQVAHALSTNRLNAEFDFFSAVDDLRKPEDGAGADMLGIVEFNSSCFYQYANVDFGQLTKNLHGDEDLARQTLLAFLRAFITAIPSGKQRRMAAQNPPSFIFVVVRQVGLWSLANAFIRPVQPTRQGNLIDNSIRALDGYWGKLSAKFGEYGIVGKWCVSLEDGVLDNLAEAEVASVDDLVGRVLDAISSSETSPLAQVATAIANARDDEL